MTTKRAKTLEAQIRDLELRIAALETQKEWRSLPEAAILFGKSEDYLRKICRYSLQNSNKSPFKLNVHFRVFGEVQKKYQINTKLFLDLLTGNNQGWRLDFNRWKNEQS